MGKPVKSAYLLMGESLDRKLAVQRGGDRAYLLPPTTESYLAVWPCGVETSTVSPVSKQHKGRSTYTSVWHFRVIHNPVCVSGR